MISLETKYVGLKLKTPFIIASSGLTVSVDKLRRCEKVGAGAVALKSIFEEQFVLETGKGKKENYRLFVENHKSFYAKGIFTPLEEYLQLIRDAKASIKIPVIASLNCISDNRFWEDFVKEIEKAGADALEVIVAMMPKSFKQTPYEIETHVYKIIYEISQHVKIPVIAKIGPYFTSIPKIAKGLSNNGASALVFFNRFYQPDIDLGEARFTSKGVFSTSHDLSIALRWISILYKEINCDLVGASGVHDGYAAAKLLLSGASAIEVASALYLHGMDHLTQMTEELRGWMKQNNYKKIDEFRGLLSQKNSNLPDQFERFQYIESMDGFH